MKPYIIALLSCALLCGCGVKPDFVHPPESVEKDHFPRTYPDLATDPPPVSPL